MSATEVGHKHRWQTTAHLDGCHYYTTVYVCGGRGCGASATVTHERDPRRMATVIWMEPQYVEVRRDERGRFCTPRWEERICGRCRELRAGAKVRFDAVVVDRDGNVLEERHEEHEQRPDEDEGE